MKAKRVYYPVYSIKFWRAYIVHMRVYLLFVSGICGLAGMAVAPVIQIDLRTFLMALIPLFLAYGFGQALTDCFQTDTDSISAPYRPLCRKDISPRSVFLVSVSGLIILVSSLICLNVYNIVWGLLSITGLATYTFFKKRYWFAGPFYNGWIVMLLPVIGFMSVTGEGMQGILSWKLIMLALLSLFSYANFVLIGYLKDISADRATGYRTFPVVFGWNKTVWAGNLFVIASIILCYLLTGHSDVTSGILLIIGSGIAVSGQLFGHLTKNKTEANSSYPVISTVRSLILWHSAVTVHYRPGWMLLLVIFYLLFELTLRFRPKKEQI